MSPALSLVHDNAVAWMRACRSALPASPASSSLAGVAEAGVVSKVQQAPGTHAHGQRAVRHVSDSAAARRYQLVRKQMEARVCQTSDRGGASAWPCWSDDVPCAIVEVTAMFDALICQSKRMRPVECDIDLTKCQMCDRRGRDL